MPADANVFAQIRPMGQQPNRLADLAQALNIQSAMGQNALAEYTLRKAQRDDADTAAMSDVYKNALAPDGTVDRSKLFQDMASRGLGARLPEVQKKFADADKATADVDKTKAETGKIGGEAVANRAKLYRDQWAQVQDPQTAAQLVQTMHADPAFANTPLTAVPVQAKLASIPTDPAAFAQWRTQMSVGAEKFAELMAQRRGQDITMRGQDMTDARTRAEGAANRGVTMRGQDMTDQRQRDLNEIQRNGKVSETSTNLRKEFEGLPEVKNYKQALPSYKGIEDAVKRNTPMSDINIVYGIAKLYDPNSVVREGEYATVAKSPAIPERIKGYAQYLAGGGKLTEEVKRQILTEAQSRMKSYEDQYTTARTNYEDIAKRSNADPTLLFPSVQTSAIAGAGGAPGLPSADAIDAELKRRAGKK